MIKFVVSRYNQDAEWLKEYAKPEEIVMYDRSDEPLPGSIEVPNIGTDIADKFQFIIDNYDNLPEMAVYTKCNLFKYIPKPEFDEVYKSANGFTPLLTQNHRIYKDSRGVDVNFYQNGMYFEINNKFYLQSHPVRDPYYVHKIEQMMGIYGKTYIPFAPGSNYILTRDNIRQHPKSFYEELRSYLMWNVYPGEGQLMERGLYEIWRPE